MQRTHKNVRQFICSCVITVKRENILILMFNKNKSVSFDTFLIGFCLCAVCVKMN